jgi:hypothetical protein
MAKDNICDDENSLDTQIIDPENNSGGDSEKTSDDSEVRTFIYLDGQFKGQRDELLVNKIETTSTEEDSLVETTEIRLKTASGCGHVLHTGSETGIACMSCRRCGDEPLILCIECAKDDGNICYICNAAACYKCRRQRPFIDGENRVVCKACIKSTLRIRFVRQLIKWLLIGAGIYYVIMY